LYLVFFSLNSIEKLQDAAQATQATQQLPRPAFAPGRLTDHRLRWWIVLVLAMSYAISWKVHGNIMEI
jgi:hypothetical protein